MIPNQQRQEHERWLLELTGIPTASGREDRVIAWIRSWTERRADRLQEDASGNLLITQKKAARRKNSPPPLLITAHLDHPAFVVRRLIDERTIELEFRGGVHDPYFESAQIEIFDGAGAAHRGLIVSLDASAKPFKRITAT